MSEAASGSKEPLRQAILAALDSPACAEFLVGMARSLGISARGSYRNTAKRPDNAVDELEGHNEVLIVVLTQLSHVLGQGSDGYPNDAFVETIWERGSKISESLIWSVEYALRRMGRGNAGSPQ